MKIGVPTEIKTDEYRVALTPAGVRELTGRSLDSARDRIDFWLALRGRELTKGTA